MDSDYFDALFEKKTIQMIFPTILMPIIMHQSRLIAKGTDPEEAQEIRYYYLIRLDRSSVTMVYDLLVFLNKIVKNMVSAKSTFLENPEQNQAIYKMIDSQIVSQQLSNLWSHVMKQPSRRIIGEFRQYVNEKIKIIRSFMQVVSEDVAEELQNIHQYTSYEIQIQIDAAKKLIYCVSKQISCLQKYDQTLSELQHYSKYQHISQVCEYLQNQQNQFLQYLKLLKKNIHELKSTLNQQQSKKNIQFSACQQIALAAVLAVFLFTLPAFIFGLAIFSSYSILSQHWNLWASSGSYFIYCWIKIALHQYSHIKNVHPIISSRCQSKSNIILLTRLFVWCTLLVESTLFLWIFMAYLFFQPTETLAMAANLLAVLSFCFELGYGFCHMEIIEALIFKCSFYEFAATFVIVSEVVFNSGLFLYFGVECGYNNAYQKLVYLIGTLCIVLIRLSYFYFKAEERQNLANLKATVLETRKKQRQLMNQIREKTKSISLILKTINDTIINIDIKKQDLLNTLNSADGRRVERVGLQISMNKLHEIHDDNIQYQTTSRINQNYEEYELQQFRRILQDLQQKQRQLTLQGEKIQQQQLGPAQRQLTSTQSILYSLQKKLQEQNKQLKQQQLFGIVFFFILAVQTGFVFDQSKAIVGIDMILCAICVVFLGRSKILFLFDLLRIRCKILLKMADQTYVIDKNTYFICLQIFGLIVSILSNTFFLFGIRSCYFERLFGWNKYIILAINFMVYITQAMVIIHSASDSIRHPFSGLINIKRIKQLQQDSKKLINGYETMSDELLQARLDKDFQERRRKLNYLETLSQQIKFQFKYLRQIKYQMDIDQRRNFIKEYQQ